MSRFELSIGINYIKDWTTANAVRELFQNALDEESVNPENEMFFGYNNGTLTIGNKTSVLDRASLLLGGTSKQDDGSTIGKFGEGYKLATLALCRLGKKITFYNYGAKEIWVPKLVNSRRYKSTILCFDVTTHIWKSVPDNNLTIVVEGITNDEYQQIVESCLHLQEVGNVIETPKGRILLDPKFKSKIFVKGLHVCTFASYDYGYDMDPKFLKLDRDRKLVSDFELNYHASQMWSGVPSDYQSLLVGNITKNSKDTRNMVYFLSSLSKEVYTEAYNEFVHTYDDKSYPVSTQNELDSVKAKYPNLTPVIVNDGYSQLVRFSKEFINVLNNAETTVSPKEKLLSWFESIENKLSSEEVSSFLEIYELLD